MRGVLQREHTAIVLEGPSIGQGYNNGAIEAKPMDNRRLGTPHCVSTPAPGARQQTHQQDQHLVLHLRASLHKSGLSTEEDHIIDANQEAFVGEGLRKTSAWAQSIGKPVVLHRRTHKGVAEGDALDLAALFHERARQHRALERRSVLDGGAERLDALVLALKHEAVEEDLVARPVAHRVVEREVVLWLDVHQAIHNLVFPRFSSSVCVSFWCKGLHNMTTLALTPTKGEVCCAMPYLVFFQVGREGRLQVNQAGGPALQAQKPIEDAAHQEHRVALVAEGTRRLDDGLHKVPQEREDHERLRRSRLEGFRASAPLANLREDCIDFVVVLPPRERPPGTDETLKVLPSDAQLGLARGEESNDLLAGDPILQAIVEPIHRRAGRRPEKGAQPMVRQQGVGVVGEPARLLQACESPLRHPPMFRRQAVPCLPDVRIAALMKLGGVRASDIHQVILSFDKVAAERHDISA